MRLKIVRNLIEQCLSQGRHEKALSACQTELASLEKAHGHNHPDLATMLEIIANVHISQNKLAEAVDLLKDALAIREDTLGKDHQQLAKTLDTQRFAKTLGSPAIRRSGASDAASP